ncbi:MAG: YjjG family noncanonical pyrimidine nucleotidase [Oscillospiraceae bacterium]|jgi:2-haloacid dehalogenase|nr:YjjG family noncanonical pyrimidine nucleotidase [Oscillospiraceae bacterium]
MPRYDLLLIDMDDTLFDFDAAQACAFAAACAEHGVPDPDAALACYSRVNEAHWLLYERGETTFEELNAARFMAFFADYGQSGDALAFGRAYVGRLGEAGHLAPGALGLVRSALASMPVTIITNGNGATQRGRLEASELAGLPLGILISEEAGAAKPDPLMIHEAMRVAGASDPSRVIMVGDSLKSDVGAARAAGIVSCWLNPSGKPAPDGPSPDYEVRSLDRLYEILGLENSGAIE